MSVNVYLADLRYNYSGVLANDCMPLGIAYMKAVMDRDLPDVRSRLFVYPDHLLDMIKTSPPDVLMLSNYCWNEALSRFFGKIAKSIRSETLVVMGGPNIPVEPDRQVHFFNEHPSIDVYVLGEGDFLAAEVVRRFMDAGLLVGALGDRPVPSSIYRDRHRQAIRNPMWARHKEIGEIPSAWLTGIQDEFFDGKLAPMIETNRGCPFTCSFCVQGTKWYTKVHNFPLDRLKEEIQYIARRIRQHSPNMGTLRIADSNYGMFERDVEISSYIGEMQRQYGWPTFIDATTGKNRPDRIIKSLEQVGGALVLYQAVQSLDEEVLRNVKRQTIKLEAYEQLQVYMRGRGLRANSDLILGLPGESLKTHLAALHRLLDGGIDQLHNFQAMMLKGSELEGIDSRERFRFDTRFRVLPKNFGVYDGEKIFDVEEIVVGTDTLPFEDYVRAREFHLTSSVFWNDSWFDSVVRFMNVWGVKSSEWWDEMRKAMQHSSPAVQQFLANFRSETINELFPTREACVEFYSRDDNFRRLENGEVGDNLMYKYRAIASFHLWSEICAAAMNASREMFVARGMDTRIRHFGDFWNDFHRYVDLKHASGRSVQEILAPASAILRYDIESWLSHGNLLDPAPYRLEKATGFEFQLSPESKRELEAALKVWSTDLKGLTKMVTRIKVAWQIRSCRSVGAEDRLAMSA